MKICFKNPITGKRVCFWIPVWVHRGLPVDPLRGVEDMRHGPMPEPWITGEDIKAELAHDLQALASIHALSETLSKGAKEAIQTAVRAQVGSLKIPEGLEVGFDR